MARVVFAPLLSEFIDTFGIGEATAGLLVTLVWVGSAAPRLPTGWLLTRVPRHHVVLGAGVVLTLASTFAAFAPGIDVLMIAAVGMGLASGVYFIAGNPLVSELFPETVGRDAASTVIMAKRDLGVISWVTRWFKRRRDGHRIRNGGGE